MAEPNFGRKSLRKGILRIEALIVPPLQNNVYILYEDGSDDALVIDVAQGANQIMRRLEELQLVPQMIINTHGHTDHTAEDGLLRSMTKAKIAIHELDAYRLALEDGSSKALGVRKDPIEPDIQLRNDQEIRLGKQCKLIVLHTPGHTEGSICLHDKSNGQLFAGDTLFKNGYGRVDDFGSDPDAMKLSLKLLLDLPDSTEVYPGHGEFTTILNERWLKDIVE